MYLVEESKAGLFPEINITNLDLAAVPQQPPFPDYITLKHCSLAIIYTCGLQNSFRGVVLFFRQNLFIIWVCSLKIHRCQIIYFNCIAGLEFRSFYWPLEVSGGAWWAPVGPEINREEAFALFEVTKKKLSGGQSGWGKKEDLSAWKLKKNRQPNKLSTQGWMWSRNVWN